MGPSTVSPPVPVVSSPPPPRPGRERRLLDPICICEFVTCDGVAVLCCVCVGEGKRGLVMVSGMEWGDDWGMEHETTKRLGACSRMYEGKYM